jgi:hypothetical protein
MPRIEITCARHAAHRDLRCAPCNALGSHAWQAGDGFGNAHVGQLADVFGRYRLDDRLGALLGGDRGFDRVAQASDDYFFHPVACRRRCGLG